MEVKYVRIGKRIIGEVAYDEENGWWRGVHYKSSHSFYGADTEEDAIEIILEQEDNERN